MSAIADTLRELAPICKEHGIRRVKAGDLEIEFGAVGDVDAAKVEEFQRRFEMGLPSDREVLEWSAPGFVPEEEGAGPVNPPKTARGRRG